MSLKCLLDGSLLASARESDIKSNELKCLIAFEINCRHWREDDEEGKLHGMSQYRSKGEIIFIKLAAA